VPVLFDVSLNIKQGEFVAIMGASGSGKSTLLHILGLLDKPTGGSYKLLGRETAGMSDDELAGQRNSVIGYIFQSFNLLPRMTATENVRLPLVYAEGGATRAHRAAPLLEQVGLADRSHHKPNQLSGGQQQRVAIARSLINEPALILADEPTGNLDSKSAAGIIEQLKELNRAGITVVMVTHEPDLATAANRIIRISDGRIVSDERPGGTVAAATESGVIAAAQNRASHTALNFRRAKDYFVQAVRALWGNKTRSALSILGVLIGVTGLIAMMALGRGAQEMTRKQMASLGSNLLIVMPGMASRHGIGMESGTSIQFTLDDADAIASSVATVAHVVPYVSGRGQVVYGANNSNTRIEGVGIEYPEVRNAVPSLGRFFTAEELAGRSRVAVLGQTVSRNLFGETSPLGEFVKINRADYLVVGVLPSKGSSGWRDDDDRVVIPVTTAMYRLAGRTTIDYMDVQVRDADSMESAGTQISSLLLQLHRLTPDKRDSVDVRNMADIQATITATMKTFSMLLGSVAFISLLVGGIGIMNIMLVSVTERTREIGLRKALGATNRDILFQFVIESVSICIMGGLFGVTLGAGIALALSKFAGWSTSVSASSIILAFSFSAGVGLCFGLWPAMKAAKLNPIEALRYE
jgi:macrolide transport system ATP-binding/permease protein